MLQLKRGSKWLAKIFPVVVMTMARALIIGERCGRSRPSTVLMMMMMMMMIHSTTLMTLAWIAVTRIVFVMRIAAT